MTLPVLCWKCQAADWIGRQEVTPPTRLDAIVWHRRTWCRFCDAAQDEVRAPGLLSITTRTQPIDWRGGNPFLVEDEDG